jgi:hypothetical protein
MLNENVKKYLELKKQADKIKEELDSLKDSIVEEMNSQNQTTFSTEDGITAKMISKITFDYQDEPAMIKWLEDNGQTSFIIKKVNTTSLNKELKTSTLLTEGLNSMYVKKSSVSLIVSQDEVK